MDLDEPADVHWIADSTPNVVRGRGPARPSRRRCASSWRHCRIRRGRPPGSAAPKKHLDYAEIQALYESDEYRAFNVETAGELSSRSERRTPRRRRP
jgi:hypothetical protein